MVRKGLHLDPATLIETLNLQIWGGTNYHRHASSKATFQKLDHLLFRLRWQWARRRHPQKNRHGRTRRYFPTVGGDHWVFFGWEPARKGSRNVRRDKASSTRISRHVKVRCQLHAHDPEWTDYLERRRKYRAARGYPALPEAAGRETAALQREAPERQSEA